MSRIAAGLLALGMSLPMAAPRAQYPSKPIRVIVPWPAGGTVDGVARVIGPGLSSGLGRPVIVENKAGAGGSIGQAEAAKAPPDGHTVLLVFDTHAVNHLLYKNLGYDPFKSFEHVSLLVTSPQVLVGATNFAPGSVPELVAFAKANPGKISCATQGNGTTSHLTSEMFQMMAQVKFQHVPYRGSAPALTDLVGGSVDIMFDNLGVSLPLVRGNQLKLIAVATQRRMAALPDVPTAAVISEAVELAGRYSTEESGRFVNGMLGRIAEEVRPER